MTSCSTAMQAFLLAAQEGLVSTWWMCDLYTFQLVDGTVFYVTTFDVPIFYQGHIFECTPLVNRSKIRVQLGMQVATVEIDLQADPTMQVGVVPTPILTALNQGKFDAALVLIDRMYMPSVGDTSLGTIRRFAGTVGPVSNLGRSSANLTINGLTELLNLPLPGIVFQPGCSHTLFDAGCTLSKAAFTFTGTCGAGGNVISFPTSLNTTSFPGPLAAPTNTPALGHVNPPSGVNLPATTYYVRQTYIGAGGESLPGPEASITCPANTLLTVASPPSGAGVTGWNSYVWVSPGDEQLQNDGAIGIGTNWQEFPTGITAGIQVPTTEQSGYFAQGQVKFTSGANAGESRMVIAWEIIAGVGWLTVVPGLPAAPANGDAISATAGCNKTQTTCQKKFNNLIHIKAFPYTPDATSVV